eukprot:scaffold1220_cov117-Isochrysis_galbana.AAC.9
MLTPVAKGLGAGIPVVGAERGQLRRVLRLGSLRTAGRPAACIQGRLRTGCGGANDRSRARASWQPGRAPMSLNRADHLLPPLALLCPPKTRDAVAPAISLKCRCHTPRCEGAMSMRSSCCVQCSPGPAGLFRVPEPGCQPRHEAREEGEPPKEVDVTLGLGRHRRSREIVEARGERHRVEPTVTRIPATPPVGEGQCAGLSPSEPGVPRRQPGPQRAHQLEPPSIGRIHNRACRRLPFTLPSGGRVDAVEPALQP